MSSAPTSLSIIICSAGRPDLALGAVECVAEQGGWRDSDEVVVVLNGDGHRDVARRLADAARQWGRPVAVGGPDEVATTDMEGWALRVVDSREAGVSRARNQGAALAGGDVLVYLDDDARPRPGWLTAWRRAFAGDADLAAAGGPIHLDWTAAPPVWFHHRLARYWSALDHPAPHGDDTSLEDGGPPVPPGDTAYGANFAVRAAALAAVEGFRPELGWGGDSGSLPGEEADVLIRLSADGHRLGWVPDAAVTHLITPDRARLRWLLRRATQQGRVDVAIGGPTGTLWPVVGTGWGTLARGLRAGPRAWRGTVAVDLARRARLWGRWRAAPPAPTATESVRGW